MPPCVRRQRRLPVSREFRPVTRTCLRAPALDCVAERIRQHHLLFREPGAVPANGARAYAAGVLNDFSERESRYTANARYVAKVDPELGLRVDPMQPRARHAFPEPPRAEVAPRQASTRHVMMKLHLRHV